MIAAKFSSALNQSKCRVAKPGSWNLEPESPRSVPHRSRASRTPTFEPHQSSGSRSDGPGRTSLSAAECDDSSAGGRKPRQLVRRPS